MNIANLANEQTVLVVDDDPNVLQLSRLYLERDGYRVITALDGNDGLSMAREEDPGLVGAGRHAARK